MQSKKQLLVIGGVSSDTLHLQSRTVKCAGGAGMYTAVAAIHCGVNSILFGPRPNDFSEHFTIVDQYLSDWIGPVIPRDQMPSFEISYRNRKTEYLTVSLNAEKTLSPEMLPTNLARFALIHVTPLGDARKQLSFVQACRERGAKRISAGTGLFNAENQAQAVIDVMEHCDYFFMNRHEAAYIFGSMESAKTTTGKVLYITLGSDGACILQGSHATLIPTSSAKEVDPTGAGDTFCGATLAYLINNKHPIMAARQAVVTATAMIKEIGPMALFSDKPPLEAPLDARVNLNNTQIQKVSNKISTLVEVSPFPFVSPVLPSSMDPKALDYFFAATAHQFSFWSTHNQQYDQPLLAPLAGNMHKGSDYLWEAFRLALEKDNDFCSPERQANLSLNELREIFRDDNGNDPMPALELHLEESLRYGKDMLSLQMTPHSIIEYVNNSNNSLQTFLNLLDKIGGYKEDPLRKKSGLLALILNQRPEKFLTLQENEQVDPVIDYHAMRFCLRIGLINVLDDKLNMKLTKRKIVSPSEEWAVRYAAYRAREEIVRLSGKSEGAVDWFFFNARNRCPEMTEPECELCQIDPMCNHIKNMFQPVLRTTFY